MYYSAISASLSGRTAARALAVALMYAFITGCGGPSDARAAGRNENAANAGAESGKPLIGSFGFDTAGMNRSVKPGDDFLEYSSGNYLRNIEIPPDQASFGVYNSIVDLTRNQLHDLLEDAARGVAAPGTDARKAGDFYASFMDEATVERRGKEPLLKSTASFRALRSKTQFARALGVSLRGFGPRLFLVEITNDPKAAQNYIPAFEQGGLGLPFRDYYLDDAANHVEARTKYVGHIARMLALAGVSAATAEARAQRVYTFERRLAQAHWSPADTRDDTKTYNKWTFADFARKAPGFDWPAFLSAAGFASQRDFLVAQPSAFAGMAKAVGETPLETLKDWAVFQTAESAAPVLPKAFVEENFAFKGTVLSGQPVIQPRWKRAVKATDVALGDVVSKLYVAKHFPPEAKAKINALVHNLTVAMDDRLTKLGWMAPETRQKARAKLTNLKLKIGYPDTWRDHSGLRIVRGDAYGNSERAIAFEYERNLRKLGKPFDPNEWTMLPTEVGAYSNSAKVELGFMASILQPPFFDPNADPAVNYGGIGAIIGHEITHLFDDQGRKYDPQGRFIDWWTPADVEHFEALAQKLVAQYDAYEPLPGAHINGQLTLGENIADLGGLALAYDAYRRSLGGREAPVIDGFTGDQRFFLGFTQNWRFKYREANLRQLLGTNEHSPLHFRTYVVRNEDAWYPAFDVKPGDKLYLAPADRVKIW